MAIRISQNFRLNLNNLVLWFDKILHQIKTNQDQYSNRFLDYNKEFKSQNHPKRKKNKRCYLASLDKLLLNKNKSNNKKKNKKKLVLLGLLFTSMAGMLLRVNCV